MTIRRRFRHALAGLIGLACILNGSSRQREIAAPLPAVRARPLTDVRFERTAERVERGRYLATAAIGCVLCHSERDRSQPGAPPVPGREFAGAIMAEEPGYRLVAPNLTPDIATGAGSWSDDMLARAIREGVGHDGRGLGGQMCWWAFRALSDEDLASIVVYLRSLPAVANALPPRILSAEQEKQRAEDAEPLAGPVAARDLADPLVRGTYLIEIADCMGCHSAWEAPTNPGIGAGGNSIARFGEHAFSANLTPDASGIGGFTEGIFRGALRSGRGGTLHGAMPWAAYRNLTDADIGAIYLALRQLPPVAHRVASFNSGAKPAKCPVCGQEHGFGELNVALVLERVAVDLGPLADYVGTYRARRRYPGGHHARRCALRLGERRAADRGGPGCRRAVPRCRPVRSVQLRARRRRQGHGSSHLRPGHDAVGARGDRRSLATVVRHSGTRKTDSPPFWPPLLLRCVRGRRSLALGKMAPREVKQLGCAIFPSARARPETPLELSFLSAGPTRGGRTEGSHGRGALLQRAPMGDGPDRTPSGGLGFATTTCFSSPSRCRKRRCR